MDFKKFSDPNFDVKEWVNAALRAPKDQTTPLDVHASTLVMKLQLFIQEVNRSLEELSLQVVQSIPRVIRDIETARHEATLLRDQMQLVKEDIKKVEENTSSSMHTLMELDGIKSQMQQTADALQEADNWTSLSADVEQVFASDNIRAVEQALIYLPSPLQRFVHQFQIADKLIGMQKSLAVLHDIPDYQDRCQKLESVKNKLESRISPKLISAFNTHSLSEAKLYAQIFTDIERKDQLQRYYTRAHKTKLVKLWQTVQSENAEKSMTQWLTIFLDDLIATWHAEVKWCSQVTSDPCDTVGSMLAETFMGLEPPLHQCIAKCVERDSLQLTPLITLRQAVVRFGHSLEHGLVTQGLQAQAGDEEMHSLARAIHSPFSEFQLTYANLEQDHLLAELGSISLEAQGLLDTVSLINDSIPKLYHLANSAVANCFAFTDGLGFVGLLSALEGFFASYLSRLDVVMLELKSICRLELPSGDQSAIPAGHGEDWGQAQNAFGLLQCCGDLLQKFLSFQSNLSSSILSNAPNLQLSASPSPRTPVSCVSLHTYNYLVEHRPAEYQQLIELVYQLETSSNEPLLAEYQRRLTAFTNGCHSFAFDMLFANLKEKLSQIPTLKVWQAGLSDSGSDSLQLPSFTLSPLTYITQIGDHLLTLPQQLESFSSHDNPSLEFALRSSTIPFTSKVEAVSPDHEPDVAFRWIHSITEATMELYFEKILKIPHLSHQSARQLSTDIEYLCNVLAALEVNPSITLKQIIVLLKAHPEQYETTAKDQNIPSRIYTRVAEIRGIDV